MPRALTVAGDHATRELQATREVAFRQLLANQGICPAVENTGGAEIAAEWLEGVHGPLRRFAVVTSSDEFRYVYPEGLTREHAEQRAAEAAAQSSELPYVIVDLDSGESWQPVWPSLVWGPSR